jgi:hypothetical protein
VGSGGISVAKATAFEQEERGVFASFDEAGLVSKPLPKHLVLKRLWKDNSLKNDGLLGFALGS